MPFILFIGNSNINDLRFSELLLQYFIMLMVSSYVLTDIF